MASLLTCPRGKCSADHGTRNTKSRFVFRVLEITQLIQWFAAEHGTQIKTCTDQFRVLESIDANQQLTAEHGTRISLPNGKVPPRVKRGVAPNPEPFWWDDG